jgi:hypothetical protein
VRRAVLAAFAARKDEITAGYVAGAEPAEASCSGPDDRKLGPRNDSVPHAGHHRAVVDIGIWRTLDDQKTSKPSLHAGQCVIYDRVISRHMKLELGDHRTAGRHRDGLNAFECWVCQTSQVVNPIEDLPDDVERRRKIRAAHAEEKSHRFAYIGMQWMQFRNRAYRAIEDEILRSLIQ